MAILLRIVLLLFVRFIRYSATRDERQQPTQHFANPLSEVQPISSTVPNVQNYEAMVAKSSQLIEKYPQDADAYSDRGGSYFLLRQFDEGLIDLNKALELKDYFADAFNNRSLLYCAQGHYEQALNDIEKAIARVPTEPAYYLNRGTCYRMMGDHLHAGKDFDQALEMDVRMVQTADKINQTYKTLPNPHIYTKSVARVLFFRLNVVLVKYMASNYSHVI